MIACGNRYEELCQKCLNEISEDISLEQIPPNAISWQSSMNPDDLPQKIRPDSLYWRKNLKSSVLFSQAIENMLEAGQVDLLIEIGPHSALQGPLKQIISKRLLKEKVPAPEYFPSLQRNMDSLLAMLLLCERLFLRNAPVDLVAVNALDCITNSQVHR